MRGLAVVVLSLLLLVGASSALRADALTEHRGAAPEATASAGLPFGGALVARLAAAQRHLNDAISAEFRDVRDTRSGAAMALILGLAFLYGVLHAIGPGHGKAVVAAYFVANRARWSSGLAMGSLISLIQGASAIAMVGLLAVSLQWRQFDVLNRSTLVELVSYGLIALLGGAMLYRAMTGRGHVHHHHAEAPALDHRLIIATGLTPCASAIIILLFALANESLVVGIAAVVALSLGMAVTVSAIGIASVLGRHTLLRALDGAGIHSHRLEQALAVTGAVVIVLVSGFLMLGAWARL